MRKKSIAVIASETRCIRSLMQSIVRAGGSVRNFTPNKLKQRTAWEFIQSIAPNDIQFLFNRPAEDKGEARSEMAKAILRLLPENESIHPKQLFEKVCKDLKLKRGAVSNKLEFVNTVRDMKKEGLLLDLEY
jgi:hypothetical protein